MKTEGERANPELLLLMKNSSSMRAFFLFFTVKHRPRVGTGVCTVYYERKKKGLYAKEEEEEGTCAHCIMEREREREEKSLMKTMNEWR